MRWLLALVSVLVAFAAAELGLLWLSAPVAPLVLTDPRFGYPLEHDPLLGYVPRPGDYGRLTTWRTQVEVTPQRLRSNGSAPPDGASILAIGDSFTWGDSVNDNETWPAHLERLLGRPVGNGGVSGYGFDQMVLRAERLVPELRPELVVLSFISDDLSRCENSYRYAPKPFFRIEGGSLVLSGVPVANARPRDPWRGLRWSRLANRVLGGLLGERWWLPHAVREHDRGLEVSLLLVERLATLEAPLLLVAQWSPRWEHGPARTVLDYAARLGLATLDLEPPLRRRLEQKPGDLWRLFFEVDDRGRTIIGHMQSAGNAWVAEQIAAAIRDGQEAD